MLVVGIGNRDRRDDGLGLAVIDALRGRTHDGAEVVAHSGEAASLMDLWSGRDTIVVDAMNSGAAPGTIRRVDVLDEELPADVLQSCSTHAFGLAQAVELGRAMQTLPPRLVVLAVEGEDFSYGEGLSESVREAVDEVVEAVIEEARCMK